MRFKLKAYFIKNTVVLLFKVNAGIIHLQIYAGITTPLLKLTLFLQQGQLRVNENSF